MLLLTGCHVEVRFFHMDVRTWNPWKPNASASASRLPQYFAR